MHSFAFGPEHFSIPVSYSVNTTKMFPLGIGSPIVCFEEARLPEWTNHHLTFRSETEADMVREAGWKYCGIKGAETSHIAEPRPVRPLRVLFSERAMDRMVMNAEKLCQMVKTKGMHVTLHVESERMDICEDMPFYAATDVIVAQDGSQKTYQVFARPGTVAIFVFPYNSYYPHWLIPNSFARLRAVDIIGPPALQPAWAPTSLSISHPTQHANKRNMQTCNLHRGHDSKIQ